MDAWDMRDEGTRLDTVVRAASDGPQRVTCDGRDAAVVLSPEAYARLAGGPVTSEPAPRTWVDRMREIALAGVDLEHDELDLDALIERDRSPLRDVDLFDDDEP